MSLMQEKDARKLWCPFVRLIAETDHAWPMSNREEKLADQGAISRCIASDCMAWRLDREARIDRATSKSIYLGYCGLAGRPE